MKWQLAVLVVIGACMGRVNGRHRAAAESSPHPGPSPSTHSSWVMPCEAWHPKCVGAQQKCTGDWHTGSCDAKDALCCSYPLHCTAGVCAMDNKNANCSDMRECVVDLYGTGMHVCINGKCIMAGNVMDSCTDDTHCYGEMKCVKGKCEGLPLNATCSYPAPRAIGGRTGYVCATGLLCSLAKLQCVTPAKDGESCTEVPCVEGLACNRGKCVAMYSLQTGTDCDNDEACSEKTTCVEGKCVDGETFDLVKCMYDSDCKAGTSHLCDVCSHVTGQRYCSGSARAIDCRKEWKKAQACYAKHHCPPVPSNNLDTCSQQHCSSETNAILKCKSKCWGIHQQLGECTASELLKYCPAFPMWAFILIGFGALIGIILVVVVVTLIVRKVRTKKAGYVPIQST